MVLFALALFATPGCSVRQYAVNKLGDALAQGGTTFASDDDPELVRQAVPFSLKMMESLLAENPRHPGLLLAAARGFTQFAYAFVQEDADEVEDKDLETANTMRVRARNLYLRARNYGLRGLDVAHAGFENQLRANAKKAVARSAKSDVPLLYWTAASWAAAIALSKDNPDFIAEVPIIEALIDRALELDEGFEYGSIHAFLVNFESARKNVPGDPIQRIQTHFDRAVKLSQGQLAGPLVSFAEVVSVQKQNLSEFQSLLKRVLAMDAKARPEWQLENLVMQRRARWLLSRTDQLFLVPEEKEEKPKTQQ